MAFLMNPLRLNSQAWAAGRILKLSIPMSSINLNYHNYCNNQHSSPSYFSLSTFRLNGSLILKQKNRFEKLRENSRHNWCSKKSTVFSHIINCIHTIQYKTCSCGLEKTDTFLWRNCQFDNFEMMKNIRLA